MSGIGTSLTLFMTGWRLTQTAYQHDGSHGEARRCERRANDERKHLQWKGLKHGSWLDPHLRVLTVLEGWWRLLPYWQT
jgi:hypothetical protein